MGKTVQFVVSLLPLLFLVVSSVQQGPLFDWSWNVSDLPQDDGSETSVNFNFVFNLIQGALRTSMQPTDLKKSISQLQYLNYDNSTLRIDRDGLQLLLENAVSRDLYSVSNRAVSYLKPSYKECELNSWVMQNEGMKIVEVTSDCSTSHSKQVETPSLYMIPTTSTQINEISAKDLDISNITTFAIEQLTTKTGLENDDFTFIFGNKEDRTITHHHTTFFLGSFISKSSTYFVFYSPLLITSTSTFNLQFSSNQNVKYDLSIRDGKSLSLIKFSSSSSPNTHNFKRVPNAGHPNLAVLMSYNIWNWNGNWDTRKLILANFIKSQNPDVVGLQEIRHKFTTNQNQMEDLASYFPGYNHIYQPAMVYTADEEGVGILTKYPILEHSYVNLTFLPSFSDHNTRVCLFSTINLTDIHQTLQFFVSHWSYSKGDGQISNAKETLNFVNSKLAGANNKNQVVVADFNIYPDFNKPVDYLVGRTMIDGTKGNFSDVWEIVHPYNLGYTFSNLEGATMMDRADRILIRGNKWKANATARLGWRTHDTAAASDHLGVVTYVDF